MNLAELSNFVYFPTMLIVAATNFNHDKAPLFAILSIAIFLNVAQTQAKLLDIPDNSVQLKRYELRAVNCDNPRSISLYQLPENCKELDIPSLKPPDFSTFEILQKTEFFTYRSDSCKVLKSSFIYE